MIREAFEVARPPRASARAARAAAVRAAGAGAGARHRARVRGGDVRHRGGEVHGRARAPSRGGVRPRVSAAVWRHHARVSAVVAAVAAAEHAAAVQRGAGAGGVAPVEVPDGGGRTLGPGAVTWQRVGAVVSSTLQIFCIKSQIFFVYL